MLNKKFTALLGTVVFAAAVSCARAAGAPAGFTEEELRAAKASPDFYTVKKTYLTVKEAEVTDRDLVQFVPPLARPESPQVLPGSIVNIAQKLWTLVEKNYPVSDIKINYASAMPEGVTGCHQLAGWQKPKAYLVTYTAENPYGMKTVTLSYRLIYTYGGSYNGKGRYLNGVGIELENVDVYFGYKLLAEAAVPDSTIVNTGTHDDPIAALQLKVTFKISTAVYERVGASIFYIDGNGAAVELAGPPSDAAGSRHETGIPAPGPRSEAAPAGGKAAGQLLKFGKI
ncbi:MAG: hypothetical protein WCK76_08760 [Elusimicrobiota bacterium]